MDKLTIEILADGTIKVTTDAVSAPNHTNAEKLLGAIRTAAGGDHTSTVRPGHAHDHSGRTIHVGQHIHEHGPAHSH